MSDKSGDRNPTPPADPLKRRGLLLGAGVAGAAVLAVKLLPGGAPVATAATAAKAAVDASGGYQLTEHVRRYYETARA